MSVEVVADGPHAEEATALRGWLVQRLIEEGYTIAPSDQADRVLRVEAEDEAVSVGSGTEAFEIDMGPPAVMQLEALHRARMLLEHVEPTHPLASEVVGLRSSTAAPEGAEGDLESALLGAGFVLTPRPRPGDTVLCVVHTDVTIGASVTRGDGACPDPVLSLTYAELRQPTGAEAIVALIEVGPNVSSKPPEVVTAPPVEVSTSAPAEPDDPPKGFLSRESEFRVGVDAGVVNRSTFDGYARAHLRLGKLQGPGGQLHVGVIPSRSGSVRAIDTSLAVGPDLRIGRKRFAAEFGLSVGALVHAYANDTARGGSADWYLGLPMNVSFGRKPDRLRAYFFSEGFVIGGRLQHIRDNAPDWARSAWGVRLGLGLTWGWAIS